MKLDHEWHEARELDRLMRVASLARSAASDLASALEKMLEATTSAEAYALRGSALTAARCALAVLEVA